MPQCLPWCNPLPTLQRWSLRVILNSLVDQAEQILEEEQAGLRSQTCATEQIFNMRLLAEKHLKHQKNLYHNFIDLKKMFDRIWHEGLWRVLKEYDIDNRRIEVISSLYDEATSAVLLNGKAGYFFQTTAGARQGCPLSPVLFNILLEKIKQKALTPVSSSENDCFADAAVEEAKETDNPPVVSVHCRTTALQLAVCRWHSCSEAVKKNCNISLEDWIRHGNQLRKE